MKKIYLDANSNYGLVETVANSLSAMPLVGNPQSVHTIGQGLKAIVEESREKVRRFFGIADNFDIFFCSGATECANWLMFCLGKNFEKNNKLVCCSAVEHACVLESFKSYIPSDQRILFSFDYSNPNYFDQTVSVVNKHLEKLGALVLIHSHNETGVQLPLEEVVDFIRSRNSNAIIITDAVQSACKFDSLNLNLFDASFISGHKIGALAGVGVLIVKKDFPLRAFIKGGSQERYLRGGTENYHAIWSLSLALDYWQNIGFWETEYRRKKEILKMELNERLGNRALFLFENLRTVPNTLHLVVEGIKSTELLVALDLRGVCCSAGSSCYSGKPITPALEGFGIPKELAGGALRLSFRYDILEEDLIEAARIISETIESLKH
ncbi:MAG: aminotransferase class V-fold PLP-dependent enzyme [Deltaproteobacteria bacterium]|nr:aminotransferase class V-fold PLP-dependent enzyme [Deltaproteobacteria bacterium]